MTQRILIVDDDSDTVEMLTMVLGQAGYSVSSAKSAQEGLRLATVSAPDLVLVDLLLPDLNGYTVLRKLRGRSTTSRIPVVMMTALPGELPQVAATEAGADAYLRKPFQLPALLSTVAASLQGGKERDNPEAAFAV